MSRQNIMLIILGLLFIYLILDYTIFQKSRTIEIQRKAQIAENPAEKRMSEIISINTIVPYLDLDNKIDFGHRWNKDIFAKKEEKSVSPTAGGFFNLSGISATRFGNTAIINSEIYSEGDDIKGYKIKIIHSDRVVLYKGGKTIILTLDE
jgi:type II secretory pathway component PulC